MINLALIRLMAATRLNDSQKQELVARFRGGASLQQLATLFGCSPTTVSRTAKAAIDLADYELLLKQLKAQRGGSSQGDVAPRAAMGHGDAVGSEGALTPIQPDAGPFEFPVQEAPAVQQGALELPGAEDAAGASSELSPALASPLADAIAEPLPIPAVPRTILGRRRRSGAASIPATPLPDTEPAPADPGGTAGLEKDSAAGAQPLFGALPVSAQAPADLDAAASPGELAIDDADDFGADDAEDGEDDLSDDSGEELFFAQGETFVAIPVGPIIDDLAIHEAVPFSAAILPSSAFLLVDKTVELQARPLRELPELGRLAEDELDRQALVVFVNPRQAKRQCGRTQRVIPLPDPSLLERTAPYLRAQGITRLVIEGALYALPGA